MLKKLGYDYARLYTGSYNAILDELNFFRALSERQGLQINSLDKTTNKLGWINVKE